jgi:hypothetical protein
VSDATDKLARTRLAIIEHAWERKHGGDYAGHRQEARREAGRREARAESAAHEGPDKAWRRGTGWFASLRRAVSAWWRHHPAHMGLEIATPMLSAYAARRPVIYLGTAAVLGAVIVVTRPWRLISATGLIVALVKSSQLSSVLMSALSAADFDRGSQPYR